MIKFLDLFSQYESIKPQVDEAIENVLKETAFIGGKYLKQFEEDFSKFISKMHIIASKFYIFSHISEKIELKI